MPAGARPRRTVLRWPRRVLRDYLARLVAQLGGIARFLLSVNDGWGSGRCSTASQCGDDDANYRGRG
jgi:hypothetical protein